MEIWQRWRRLDVWWDSLVCFRPDSFAVMQESLQDSEIRLLVRERGKCLGSAD